MSKRMIYFDHAATTKVGREAFDAMMPFLKDEYGNPSSIHAKGRNSKAAVENARQKVAKAIGADKKEIYFTAGGTESDNWAIKGAAYANRDKGRHIITSAIEHHAVLHTCEYLKKHGYDITYVPVDENGIVKMDELKKAIRKDTILITVMFANNEIGTIQPIKEIGKTARGKGIIFHTDAVQAMGSVPIDVDELNIDLLSLSAHKFYGPKGIGVLYKRKGIKIDNFIHGGAQERKRRAGTENTAFIAALGSAIESAVINMEENNKKIIPLRDRIIDEVLKKIPYTKLNGHRYQRLPGNVNFSFEYIEGESILLMLDMKGICASSGSACTSGSLDPSHVLLAIGLSHQTAHGSLRISLGKDNTKEEADYLLDVLPEIIDKLRQMSPLYKKEKGEK